MDEEKTLKESQRGLGVQPSEITVMSPAMETKGMKMRLIEKRGPCADKKKDDVAIFLAHMTAQGRTASMAVIGDSLGISRGSVADKLHSYWPGGLVGEGLAFHYGSRPRQYEATALLMRMWKSRSRPNNHDRFFDGPDPLRCEACGRRTDYTVHFCGFCGSPCKGGGVSVGSALDSLASHIDVLSEVQARILTHINR